MLFNWKIISEKKILTVHKIFVNTRISTLLKQDGKSKGWALKHTRSRWDFCIVFAMFCCTDFGGINRLQRC